MIDAYENRAPLDYFHRKLSFILIEKKIFSLLMVQEEVIFFLKCGWFIRNFIKYADETVMWFFLN
jgi:hypothetical protein